MRQRVMTGFVAAVTACLLLGGLASAQSMATVNVAKNAKYGQILVNAKGMTLYMFKKDTNGTSVCYGKCASIWPALTTTGTPTLQSGVGGSLGVSMRKNGAHQVTYDGMPLYVYSGDAKPGQTNGQGFLKLWYVIHPKAMASAASTSTANLPKTGSDPLVAGLGVLLLGAGAGLLVRRKRSGAGRRV